VHGGGGEYLQNFCWKTEGKEESLGRLGNDGNKTM
jgi:hypothetical protein